MVEEIVHTYLKKVKNYNLRRISSIMFKSIWANPSRNVVFKTLEIIQNFD